MHVRAVGLKLLAVFALFCSLPSMFGQAITATPAGVPAFDREKCIHCGACIWNCGVQLDEDPARSNITFTAGAGGLHSNEN